MSEDLQRKNGFHRQQLAAGAGRTALGPEVGELAMPLAPLQMSVLEHASLGSTSEEAAQGLHIDTATVEAVRDGLIEDFNVQTPAALVSQAIKTRLLPIEVTPNPGLRLGKRDVPTLKLIAAGYNNREIGRIFKKNPDTFFSNVIRPLFSTLKANGRNHSVRRAYELGILKIDD